MKIKPITVVIVAPHIIDGIRYFYLKQKINLNTTHSTMSIKTHDTEKSYERL